MTISFRVEDYLPAAVEEHVFEPVFLPKGKMDDGIPACHARDDGGRHDPGHLDPAQRVIRGACVQAGRVRRQAVRDRLRHGPQAARFRRSSSTSSTSDSSAGTEQPTKFVSHVRLTDQSRGINDQAQTISMNEPMTHRGFTFYQSRYSAIAGPAYRPAHRPVPVGSSGGNRSGPADQVRRMHRHRPGHLRSVLHASGSLHRRRQAGTGTRRSGKSRTRERKPRAVVEAGTSNRGRTALTDLDVDSMPDQASHSSLTIQGASRRAQER